MAFRDEDMRAIVETGEFADPKVVDYIARVLIERRDKIGRLYFGKVLPLDNFTIRYGELKFDDLAVKYGFGQPPAFEASWFAFDNHSAKESPAAGAAGMRVPEQARQAADGSYWGARIRGAE
jgi:hypothetical protein